MLCVFCSERPVDSSPGLRWHIVRYVSKILMSSYSWSITPRKMWSSFVLYWQSDMFGKTWTSAAPLWQPQILLVGSLEESSNFHFGLGSLIKSTCFKFEIWNNLPTWCNWQLSIYLCSFSSTCFGLICPSSGAMDVTISLHMQHMVSCKQV